MVVLVEQLDGMPDDEIKEKIKCRRELHKRMVDGRGNLWGEYCRLCKEVKDLRM